MNLKAIDISYSVFINALLMLFWHLLCFLFCINLKESWLNPKNVLYIQRSWENDGKWYVKTIKIKKWKDFLPQYIGKNGFSKKNLELKNSSKNYIDKFIRETCRAEWDHSMNCIYAAISVLISSFEVGIIFAILTLVINLPFIAIQRYNRFRLQMLQKQMLKRRVETQYNYNNIY